MLLADRDKVVELAKKLCPGFLVEATGEEFTFTQELSGLRIRFFSINTDRYEDFHSRIIIQDKDITDEAIFRKRLDISDDQEIDVKLRDPLHYILSNKLDTEGTKQLTDIVCSVVREFDHALHRTAEEGAEIQMLPIEEFIKNIPERKPLVEGLINQGEVVMCFAPTNAGATMLLLNLAACCVTGRDFLGFKIPEPLKVGYWDFENDPVEMESRIKALNREFPGFKDKLIYYRDYEHKIGNIGGEATLKKLILKHDLDILIPDNLPSFKGEHEENTDEIVDPVMIPLCNAAGFTRCAIVFPHHTKKEAKVKGGYVRYPDEPRGFTEIEGKCDASYKYIPIDDRDNHVSIAANSTIREFKSRKIRATNKRHFRMVVTINPLNHYITQVGDELVEEPEVVLPMNPEQIRELRTKLNITQKELADRIETSERSVIRWEKGEADPQEEQRRKLWELWNGVEL